MLDKQDPVILNLVKTQQVSVSKNDGKSIFTESLIRLIKNEETPDLEKYLAFLTGSYGHILSIIKYELEANFLIKAIVTNNMLNVYLLLKALTQTYPKNPDTPFAMILYALSYAKSDDIIQKLDLYLNKYENIQGLLTTYGPRALKFAIIINNQIGMNAIEALLIKHYQFDFEKYEHLLKDFISLFRYAALNNRFALAKFLLEKTSYDPRLLNHKRNKVSIIHECLENNNMTGILFLTNHGADLCSRRVYIQPKKSSKTNAAQCGYFTIFEIMILKQDYENQRTLLKHIITLMTQKKLNSVEPFLNHLIHVYDYCKDITAFNIMNDFDFGFLLQQNNAPPQKDTFNPERGSFYDAILPSLKKHYERKNHYARIYQIQSPLIKERIDEIDFLLNMLSEMTSIRHSCLFLHPIDATSTTVNQLKGRRKKIMQHAIDAVKRLGFPIDDMSLHYLITRFKDIQEILKHDIERLKNTKDTLHQYTTEKISHSLLLLDVLTNKTEIEMSQIHQKVSKDTSIGSLRTPLLS